MCRVADVHVHRRWHYWVFNRTHDAHDENTVHHQFVTIVVVIRMSTTTTLSLYQFVFCTYTHAISLQLSREHVTRRPVPILSSTRDQGDCLRVLLGNAR